VLNFGLGATNSATKNLPQRPKRAIQGQPLRTKTQAAPEDEPARGITVSEQLRALFLRASGTEKRQNHSIRPFPGLHPLYGRRRAGTSQRGPGPFRTATVANSPAFTVKPPGRTGPNVCSRPGRRI
jgi:hypothetical protein